MFQLRLGFSDKVKVKLLYDITVDIPITHNLISDVIFYYIEFVLYTNLINLF